MCKQNLLVGLFSSVRLRLLPDNNRWSSDTETQLDEEPSPRWWFRVQRQRERERASMRKHIWHVQWVKHHWWYGTPQLLFGVLCLFSLKILVRTPSTYRQAKAWRNIIKAGAAATGLCYRVSQSFLSHTVSPTVYVHKT